MEANLYLGFGDHVGLEAVRLYHRSGGSHGKDIEDEMEARVT